MPTYICAIWAAFPHSSCVSMYSASEDMFIQKRLRPCAILFYMFFFTINGMVVSIICCHNVSLLQSQSFFGSEPTLPPTVFICTSHNQQTPHSHTNTTSKCMLTICSLPQTAKTHKTQTHRQTLSAQTSEKEIDWSS